MTAQFLAWWRQRSLREQRLLLLMFALLAATVLWLGILRPVQSVLSRAREHHAQAVIRLGEVRAQADALRGFKGAAVPGPLAPLLTAAAIEAGFANAGVMPQGDRRVSVSIPSARPAPLLAWMAVLEGRGIVVERFAARSNGDQTITVEATLVSGG